MRHAECRRTRQQFPAVTIAATVSRRMAGLPAVVERPTGNFLEGKKKRHEVAKTTASVAPDTNGWEFCRRTVR